MGNGIMCRLWVEVSILPPHGTRYRTSRSPRSAENIQNAVNKYLTENPVSVDIATTEKAGIVTVGKNLSITKDGVLSVDTTNDAGQDNTKPITSAGVNLVVGNINALLAII